MENKLSFGAELEWSDIDRTVDIPEQIGFWEGPKIAGYYMGSEIDVVNTKGEEWGKGTDPLCITSKVGGEINVQPSSTIDIQFNRILEIMDEFSVVETGPVNHGHIHVNVEGIREDLETVKNLFAYTKANEEDLIKGVYDWNPDILTTSLADWCKEYLQFDGGRSISDELYDLVEKAKTVEEVINAIKTTSCVNKCYWGGKTTLSSGKRTAFNLSNLMKGSTVEFRCLRSSKNPVEIYSALLFAKRYVEEAIKGKEGKPVKELLKEYAYEFPKMHFNEALCLSWEKTRQTKGRGGPFKKYTGVVKVHDVVFKDYSDILSLVKKHIGYV